MKKYTYKVISNNGNYETTNYKKLIEYINSLRDDMLNGELVYCETYVITHRYFHKPVKELIKDLTFRNF